MNGNGHADPDLVKERVLASEVIYPESWRLSPGISAEAQAKIRADRLRELDERYGGEAA